MTGKGDCPARRRGRIGPGRSNAAPDTFNDLNGLVDLITLRTKIGQNCLKGVKPLRFRRHCCRLRFCMLKGSRSGRVFRPPERRCLLEPWTSGAARPPLGFSRHLLSNLLYLTRVDSTRRGTAGAFSFTTNRTARHKTLRTTPAMAAGVSKRLWEMSDIVDVLETWEAAARA